jgi:hypothetical protein
MDILNQSIQLSGEPLNEINNVVSVRSGIALYDKYTGEQMLKLSPSHGQLVTIKSGGTGTTKELAPSLNNKLYYLVSDVSYDESQTDEIISLATEIPVVLTSGIFVGEFTFLNPNNYENAYFLWDYSDKILNSASYIGSTSNRSMSISFNNNAGRCGVNYNVTSAPTRFQFVVNGEIQKDTGYVGLNTQQNYDDLIAAGVLPSEISLSSPYNGSVNNGKGQIITVKNTGTLDASVVVSSPFSTSSWSIKKINPYTTSFSINPTKDNTPCGKSTTATYYHNGSNLTPIVGDVVYSASNVAFIGEDLNYYIGNNIFINIDNNGIVTSIDDCYSKGPFAVPYIYESDIVYSSGDVIKRPVYAIGGPTSWTLVSSSPVSQSIYSNGFWNIDGNTPKGEYVITINATNSFGTSPNKTINVSVPDLTVTRPVEMDIGMIHYGTSSPDVCSKTGVVLTTMFFSGTDQFQQVPSKGSFIYYDSEGLNPFNGGGFWYYQANYALRISAIGSVMDTHTCDATTTTTTTTTTVPSGAYYNARSCIDPSVEITLLDTLSQGIVVGNVVKTAGDLNCWTILSVNSASYPYKLIVSSAVKYASCSACTTISTTTTTTTTTTAPTFTSFSLATNAISSSAYNSCVFASPTYVAHYHNGGSTLPVVGDFVYTNNTGTTPFDGQFKWYIMLNAVKFAVNISNTGQVINVIACSTATTTTTTTTIPLRKCIATRCDNNSITQILSYTSENTLSVNTVVRDANGYCYTITTDRTTGTAYSSILFIFNKCSDCLSKTTTTSTSTTSTSTSSTSTSTTTTTTIAPGSSILDFLNLKDTRCNTGIIAGYFTDGDLFVDVLYTDRGMTTVAPAGIYKSIISKQGAYWDGVSTWYDPFSCV